MGARATGVMRVTRSPIFSGGPARSQRQLTGQAAHGVWGALIMDVMRVHDLPTCAKRET